MHRNDTSKYLLYIEPKASEKLQNPIEDELTQLMEMALSKAKRGGANYSDLEDMGDGYTWTNNKGELKKVPSFTEDTAWRGTHRTECGEGSSNCDFLLENGMITNSLAPFYLRWYRYSISENDMRKLEELKKFYSNVR
jgi:hypothetical protein